MVTFEGPQEPAYVPVFTNANANGDSVVVGANDPKYDGYTGQISFEVTKSGTGTASVTPYGSNDGTTWYPLYYQQADGVPPASRTTQNTAIALAAGAQGPHNYQVVDVKYREYKLTLSAVTGAVLVNAAFLLFPMS